MMLLGVLFCESQTNGTWHVMYLDTRKDNGSCRIVKENRGYAPKNEMYWESGIRESRQKRKKVNA